MKRGRTNWCARAAPPVIKPVALGDFVPGTPVANTATGRLSIQDSKLQGSNGASFGTERVALVKGGDEYSPGATYAASMQIDASQPVELRHVVEQTPPTDNPADAFCGGAPTGYIALAKVGEGDKEMVKVLALQGHPEMTEDLVQSWLTDWAHLLDETQPSQQARAKMLEDLPTKVKALNHVAEGFYRRWLDLAFG